MWQQFLVIGLGGASGAIARFALTGLLQRRWPGFPWGTLAVNVAGCLLIGVVMTLVTDARGASGRPLVTPAVQTLLITGFLGSLTTFSTFGYETVELLRQSEPRLALWNVLANIVLGFAAVCAGRWIVKLFV
ncbi:MAG: fluoride efflux transporter CrcB [Planctomycetaceae bacterium]